MSTSAWTTWPSIHPLLWLLLSVIVRIIMEVRQLAKYLGLEDPTCTLLLEHPNKTSSFLHTQDSRRFGYGRRTEYNGPLLGSILGDRLKDGENG